MSPEIESRVKSKVLKLISNANPKSKGVALTINVGGDVNIFNNNPGQSIGTPQRIKTYAKIYRSFSHKAVKDWWPTFLAACGVKSMTDLSEDELKAALRIVKRLVPDGGE